MAIGNLKGELSGQNFSKLVQKMDEYYVFGIARIEMIYLHGQQYNFCPKLG